MLNLNILLINAAKVTACKKIAGNKEDIKTSKIEKINTFSVRNCEGERFVDSKFLIFFIM